MMSESDRAFHKKRWERKAEQESTRGAFERFLDKNGPDRDDGDFMHEEAKRDDEDFEKKFIRESKREYETWEKHTQPIRDAILNKVRNPEAADYVIVYGFLPGGMRAGGIAGAALGSDLIGADSSVIDYAVGSSSGDNVATRFVGGREQLLRGIAMFTGPLSSKKFIGPRPGNVINLSYVRELEEGGDYALDQEAIKNAHCKLWTIVTEPIRGTEEARTVIIDKKAIKEGMSAASVATMSIPLVTGQVPEIDGKKYYDGGFAAFPIKEIIKKVQEENPGKRVKMLLFTQSSFEPLDAIKPEDYEVLAGKLMHRIAGPVHGIGSLDSANTIRQLAKGLITKENLRKSLEAIESETGADIGVEWAPPSAAGMTTIDSDEIKAAVMESMRKLIDRFGGTQPDVMPEYHSPRAELKQAIQAYRRVA